MKTRIITATVMVLIGIPLLIFAPSEVYIGLAGLLSLVAAFELIRMFEKKNEAKISFIGKTVIYTLTLFLNLTISLLWYFKTMKSFDINLGNIYLLLLLSLMFIAGLLIVLDNTIDSNLGSKVLLIATYAGIGFSSLPILRMYSKGLLIYVLVIATFTDTFAYFFGVAFGTKFIKKRPAPVISPKKSFEGCIAGTIFGSVFGALVFIFYNELFADGGTLFINVCKIDNNTLAIILAIILSLVASFIGQIGDLVASKLKRDNDIKDYGNIFPGHGGVLDRFDSFVFISMFLCIIFLFLGAVLPL